MEVGLRKSNFSTTIRRKNAVGTYSQSMRIYISIVSAFLLHGVEYKAMCTMTKNHFSSSTNSLLIVEITIL